MALEKSEAIILKSFNWSESSRTVVFFSREHGKLALIDKGGRSIKSKRGRLLPFCRLDLLYYASRKEGSGYISGNDIIESFSLESEGSLGRLAYGSAACELLYLLLPERQEQPELYELFIVYLKQISLTNKFGLPALFLAFFLRLLSLLGYHPSIAFCTGCSRELEDRIKALQAGETLAFSPQRGGLVCSSCQQVGQKYIGLSGKEFSLLANLQTLPMLSATAVHIGYEEAARLTEPIIQFISYQTGLGSKLKSLDFLDKLKNAQF